MDIWWETLTYMSQKLKILPRENCKEIHAHSYKTKEAKDKKNILKAVREKWLIHNTHKWLQQD